MEFRLKITCDSPAFGDKPELHLADILRGIANTVQYVGTAIEERPSIHTPVHDVNGSLCGAWILQRNGKKESKRDSGS